MTDPDTSAIGMWGLVTTSLAWALLWLAALLVGRRDRLPVEASPTADTEKVSVVIAARNEAANLADCLRSVLAQQGVKEVILVDDHSEDQTVEVARQTGEGDQRLRIISNPDVPPEWTGKSFALHTGAREATGTLILFCDADVSLAPGLVRQAADFMEREGLDHLSSHFFVNCRTLAEHVCAPILVLSSSLALFGTAHWMAAGTGAFNMVRTATYRRLGAHEPIRKDIVDDVALARHLHSYGARSRFVFTEDRVQVRLFAGWRGFIDSVSRSSIPFLEVGGFAACAVSLLFIVFILWTTFGPLWLMLLGWPAQQAWVLGCAPYVLGLCAVLSARRFTDAKAACSVLYPLAASSLGCGVLKAGFAQLRGRPVTWRGREYATVQACRQRLRQTIRT